MSEERYAEHTVAWELPNGDSATKGNYNLADIETKYMPIQTEMVSDDKDKKITDLEAKLADKERNNLLLYSMLYETLEKQDPENVSSRIDQMTGETLDKQSEWFKTNRVCDELKKQLTEKEKEIEQLNNRILISQLQAPKKQISNILGSQCIQYNPDQSKTEFAIQQLERVKEYIHEHRVKPFFEERYIVYVKSLNNEIDQIIKELEGK